MFVQLRKDGCLLWVEVTGIQGEVCEQVPSAEHGSMYPVGMVVDVKAPEIIDLKV